MAESEVDGALDVSLFALGTELVRQRRRIAVLTLGGAFLAATFVLTQPSYFKSSTSFFSQQTDAGRSGLASLAGQFGVALSTSANSASPEFYSRLVKSAVVLRYVARDTIVVEEQGRRRTTFMELFGIPNGSAEQREELAVRRLMDLVATAVVKPTGVVEVSVATKWPSVSYAIVSSILNGVNDFNRATKQAQAADERRFIEGRLKIAEAELRDAEDKLARFAAGNRSYGSPELSLEAARLQRIVALRQAVFTALEQSYDDVRIREVRDTPTITVIEPARIPAQREARKTIQWTLLGAATGALIAILWSLLARGMDAVRRTGAGDVNEFFETLAAAWRSFPRPWKR